MKFRILLGTTFVCPMALAAGFAQVETKQSTVFKEAATPSSPINDFFNRIRPYEGNVAFFDYFHGEELDGHIDVQYSFRYLFTAPKELTKEKDSLTEWAFTFSGEFDFYAGTRDSGPVIGRRYNPGLRFQKVTALKSGMIAWDASLEHESNGQVINNLESVYSTQRGFERQYRNDYPNLASSYYLKMATDSVSRSTSHFISIGGTYRFSLDDDIAFFECSSDFNCFELYMKFRKGFDFEDDVFWDPSMLQATLREHQGTQLALYNKWKPNNALPLFEGTRSLAVIYRTGEILGGSPGKKNTFDINYTFNIKINKLDFPLIISYHHGYLEDLSRYSYKSSYWRFGFHLDL